MRRRDFLFLLGGLLVVPQLRAAEPLDLNTATKEQLVALPGIGEKLAEQIIENRPYGKVEDLLQIPRFGEKRLDRLRGLVTVSEAVETGQDEGDEDESETNGAGPRATPPPAPKEWTVPAGYKVLRCWRCQEVFAVEAGTEAGVCPYCGVRWGQRGAKP
jgi:helix-hairpin-helix protein